MKMRNKHSIRPVVLFAMSIGLILLSGCETLNHSKKSREVTFGARIYSGLATKTEYSGVTVTEGENPTITYERINWLDQDKIRIYSPEVVRRFSELNNNKLYNWADYEIVGNTIDNTVNHNRSSRAKLRALNQDVGFSTGNGLFWSDELEGKTASFYAVYPAPANDDGVTVGNPPVLPAGAEGTISCSLPGTQAFSKKGNMGYAYMTAIAKDVGFEDNVDLEFYPAFTAFEFHLKIASGGVEKLYFDSFELSSTSTPLVGDYSVTCGTNANNKPVFGYTCPDFDDSEDSPNNCVSVDLGGVCLKNENNADLTTDDITELIFTVFTLPKDDMNAVGITDLSISFYVGLSQGSYTKRTLDFKKGNNWLVFKGCAKHIINGLTMKGEQWQLEIDGQVLPWTSYEETIDQKITFELYNGGVYDGKAVVVGGAIESQNKWLGSGTNAAGLNKDNHYADSNWKLYGETGYGEGAGNYDKNYQIRTLDNKLDESERYFTMKFAPTAPTGGYWKLIPKYHDEESSQHFRFEVIMPDGQVSSQLTGPIINSWYTVKIIPVDWTPSTLSTYDVWFECFVSPSVNFTPSLNADSEFQDVHGDGRFSYWVFRLAYYTENYHDDE